MKDLPLATPSLCLRPFVLEDVPRIMALNGEPTTRRWLPTHVYATPEDAVSAIGFLISCSSSPGDPSLGPYVLAVDHGRTGELLGHVGFSPLADEVMKFQGATELVSRDGWHSQSDRGGGA